MLNTAFSIGRAVVRSAMMVVMFAICLLEVGCGAPVVWQAQIPSPDGRWVAMAKTVQNGGFGTASIITTVSIKRNDSSQSFTEVLAFSCEGPVPRSYVLDNIANAGGTINLKMNWATPAHLDVTYSGRADLGFQVVKYSGIEISVEDTSKNSATNPH